MRTIWSVCVGFNIILILVRLAVFLVVRLVLQIGTVSVGHYCLIVTLLFASLVNDKSKKTNRDCTRDITP